MVPGEDDPDCTSATLRIGTAAIRASVMTAGIPLLREPNRCICGRCEGTGFDRDRKQRSCRKCPRCKGAGSTQVGSTKR